MTPFRVYEPSECGKDGYPFEWHNHADKGAAMYHRCMAIYGAAAFVIDQEATERESARERSA